MFRIILYNKKIDLIYLKISYINYRPVNGYYFKIFKYYPDLVLEKFITDFSGKKIAIDISILLYQVVISHLKFSSDLINKKGEITSHVLGLFNKTVKLLNKGIIPFMYSMAKLLI